MRTTTIAGLVCATVIVNVPLTGDTRSALTDSTDVKIRNSSGVDAVGAENTIYIHPTDSRIVLEAHNVVSGGSVGIAGWVSQDGGKTWSGDNSFAGGAASGDPAAVIRRSILGAPVQYVVGQLIGGTSQGTRVVHKESATSLTWTPTVVYEEPLLATDKPHLWVDNHPSSPAPGRVYLAWHSPVINRVQVSPGLGAGGFFPPTEVDTDDPNGSHLDWAVNIKVATDSPHRGDVYAVWGVQTGNPTHVAQLKFNKSINAGGTWGLTPSVVASPNFDGYMIGEALPGKSMGTNTAPTMAVDDAGNIYVVWGQKNSGAGSDGEIYVVKSSDQGSTWTALGTNPKRVNQDYVPVTGNTDQWLPWVTWDDCTDAVVVIFYDSREDNTSVNTYIAVSYNGGVNFAEVKVSDVAWSGDISDIANDYIGVAARDGIAYPAWSDDREIANSYKVYTSPILLWGIEQSSVVHSFVADEGLELTVTVNWHTSIGATAGDALLLTSPTGVEYSISGIPHPPQTHTLTKHCACETGTWKYTVVSTRLGFTPRASDQRTVKVKVCVD